MSSKYHPAQIDEIEARPSSINRPLLPENVISLPKARPPRGNLLAFA